MTHVAVINRCQREHKIGSYSSDLVGVAGFEPTAPRSQSECATKLRHTPVHRVVQSAAYATIRILPRPPLASHTKAAPGTLGPLRYRGACGRSSMVEPQPSKLAMPVRSRSPAPPGKARSGGRLP